MYDIETLTIDRLLNKKDLWRNVYQKLVLDPFLIGAIALSYPLYCYWWLMKKRGWKVYRSPNPNPMMGSAIVPFNFGK